MVGVSRRPLLQRIGASPLNYWATFVTDIAVGVGFAWLGTTRYPGSGPGAAVFIMAGIVAWPLFEYSLHRWILHGHISPAFRGDHARHHARPHETAGTPWLASTVIGILFWSLLAAVLSGPVAALVMSGFYVGYIYFVIVHRMQHYHPDVLSRWWFFGNQMRLHALHHEQPNGHFGITTSMWDRIFGTFRVSSRFFHDDEVVVEQPRS